MWKLNKLDTWIMRKLDVVCKRTTNNYPRATIAFVIAILVIFLGVILLYNLQNQQSLDYTKGYNDGFSEMNVTKYNVAIAVTENNVHRLNSNSEYVNGYMQGYNAALLEKADIIMGTNCST